VSKGIVASFSHTALALKLPSWQTPLAQIYSVNPSNDYTLLAPLLLLESWLSCRKGSAMSAANCVIYKTAK